MCEISLGPPSPPTQKGRLLASFSVGGEGEKLFLTKYRALFTLKYTIYCVVTRSRHKLGTNWFDFVVQFGTIILL